MGIETQDVVFRRRYHNLSVAIVPEEFNALCAAHIDAARGGCHFRVPTTILSPFSEGLTTGPLASIPVFDNAVIPFAGCIRLASETPRLRVNRTGIR